MIPGPGTELRVALALRGLTSRDVARRAGLSESKLSRVLHDRVRANPETVARIRAAIYSDEAAA